MIEGPKEQTRATYELEDIFRQTYFFSQGSPLLQKALFEWIVAKKILTFDDIKLIPEKPEWVKNLRPPKKHSQQSVHKIIADTDSEWASLKNILRNERLDPNRKSENVLLKEILSGILTNDLFYQMMERPERDSGKGFLTDGKDDPHKSFLRYYVLHKNFISEPFSTLNSNLLSLIPSMEASSNQELEKIQIHLSKDREEFHKWINSTLKDDQKLGLLIKLWEQHHPGEKFFS